MAKAKIYKNPLKWLFNIEVDERKSLGINLTPESNEELKAVLQENATLKGQLGRIQIRDKKIREEERKIDKEKKIIKDLKLQEKEINKKRYGETISMGKFFAKYISDKYFRDKLKLMDKDGIECFGKFGDIVITKNRGSFVVLDSEGNPVAESKSIDGIIYKPESLESQLDANRLLLPYDKDRNPVIDFESIEMGELEFDPDENRYFMTREAKKKAKDIVIEKIKEIQEKNDRLEVLELSLNDLQRELHDEKRAKNILKNQIQTTKSELTEAMGMTMQFNSKVGEMQSKITNLTEIKAMYEKKITALEYINNKMIERIEQSGDRTLYEQVKQDIHSDVEFYKNILPESVVERPVDTPKAMSKPGQVLEASKVQ
jgi:hypothetical protein